MARSKQKWRPRWTYARADIARAKTLHQKLDAEFDWALLREGWREWRRMGRRPAPWGKLWMASNEDIMNLELNKPIVILYANLLKHGIRLSVQDGKLRVQGNGVSGLSPAYREEIKRRAQHLVELLGPNVPESLRSHFGRLLSLDEAVEAQTIANQAQVQVTLTPVNGGWILTMRKLNGDN